MKKFIDIVRSIKDYIIQYENIHKLFMMPKKEIKIPKENRSISKLENLILVAGAGIEPATSGL